MQRRGDCARRSSPRGMKQLDRWLPNTLLVTLVVLGTLLRFGVAVWDNPTGHLFSDPARHWDNAVNFFHPGLMGGFDPILYQVYLFIVLTVSRGNALVIGTLTGLLSAAMPWIYYRAARDFGLGKNWAMSYWILMAWLPSFFSIYRYFMMETLLLPMIGLGLWMTGRALRKNDLPSFWIMTIVWILAVLTKAQAIPLAAVCWGYALRPLAPKALAIVTSLVAFAVLLIPNAIRSHAILGYFAPLGSSYIARIMHESGAIRTEFNLSTGHWGYSSPSCYIMPMEPLNHWRIERGTKDVSHQVQVNLNHGRRDWEAALAEASRSASEWWWNLFENIVLFFFAPSWPDTDMGCLGGWLNNYSRWLWAPLFCQVLVGNAELFLRRRFPLVPVATSLMLLVLIFQNSITMEGRYRKPLEPLLILNALMLWATPRRPGNSKSESELTNNHSTLI